MTHLTYNLALEQHGDNACRDSTANVTMHNGQDHTFLYVINSSDIEVALLPEGFNYTVQIATQNAPSAYAHWYDPRAVQEKQAEADGWVQPLMGACQIHLLEFCLVDMYKIN